MTAPAQSGKPAGRYGIDAPWVPWLWVALGALYVVFAALSGTAWGNPLWFTLLLAVVALLFFGCGALYWHATLRGKFLIWDELLNRAGSPGRALDLGCGRGAVSIMTARRFPRVTVDGVDLWRDIDQSGNTPEAARQNARENGVDDRIRFSTGNMTRLPFADDCFDLVTASLAIHNIHSMAGRRAAIDEAWRVLRPGGRLLILDISKTRDYVRRLGELGAVDITAAGAGWRVWWSGPWMASRTIVAIKPEEASVEHPPAPSHTT
ncbi:MAG: class I SAM-dependent methyltransferase [Actinobacteria bacterium]|nr:class I SAM-dependent methyltransferase [Actinomycetota bacterium]